MSTTHGHIATVQPISWQSWWGLMSTDVHCRSLQDINHSTSRQGAGQLSGYSMIFLLPWTMLTWQTFLGFSWIFLPLFVPLANLILRKASDSHFRCCGDRGGLEIMGGMERPILDFSMIMGGTPKFRYPPGNKHISSIRHFWDMFFFLGGRATSFLANEWAKHATIFTILHPQCTIVSSAGQRSGDPTFAVSLTGKVDTFFQVTCNSNQLNI